MSTSFSPKFVRARVAFNLDGRHFPAGEHLLNSSGVPGFPWVGFDPMKELGKRAQITVQTLTKEPWEFNCEAVIGAERSGGPNPLCLAFNFILDAAARTRLDALVAAEGVLPDYVRKFPRIHYMSHVPVFPSRALVKFYYTQNDIAVCCDIENVSPSGFLVHTEDGRAGALMPEETVRVEVLPRGQWLRVVAANAVIKRITHSVDPDTGNVRRYLGLALGAMSAESKINFTDLLKQIVLQARK